MPTKFNPSLLIAALALMMIFGGMAWWINLNENPVAVVPTPVMPVPNAFDDFVAAGNAVVDQKGVDAATIDAGYALPMATLAMKQDAIAENPVALARLRIGLTRKYRAPPARSYADPFPYYAKFRGLARLLRVEAQVRAARGDWNGATQSSLDSIQLGIDLPHGSGLIGMLVGNACEAIGRKDVWTYSSHLNAAQAKSAALRLEAMERDRSTFGATMQEEKWTTQATLLQTFRQGNVYQMIREMGVSSMMGGATVPVDPGFLLYSKRAMFNNISKAMDDDIRIGNLTYYQAVRAKHKPIPPDPLSKIILPVFDQGHFKLATTEAENALLETALALRAYDLEHHGYPATLSQLTPTYLSHVPDDPFAASGPLGYHRVEASYVLYSVGPDGVDDGGRPIPESATGPVRFIEVTSKGDIVAGVTIR